MDIKILSEEQVNIINHKYNYLNFSFFHYKNLFIFLTSSLVFIKNFRLFLVEDMQTLPPQKEPFFSSCCEMFWNDWKINFPIFAIFYFSKYNRSIMGKFVSIWLQKKKCIMFWNGFLSSWVFFVRCLVFQILPILYFTFEMHSVLRRIHNCFLW